MKRTLFDGSTKFEILWGNASVLEFADTHAALSFLRPFRDDAAQMAVFREEIGHVARDVDRLDVDQILERFAALLVSGRVRLLRSYQPSLGTATVVEDAGQKKGEQIKGASVAAVVKKHWVEFRVVDDQTGEPVKGIDLTVRLPDGSTEIRTTDAGGYVEITEILRGDCVVSCDMTGAELSRSLEFVRTS